MKITVLILILQNGKVLVEKRAKDSSLAGHFLIPGGRAEEHELDSLETAMIREAQEELGITPTEFINLTQDSAIAGETSYSLILFYVTKWEGQIAKIVLDKGNPLTWKSVKFMENSPLPSVREIISRMQKHLKKTSPEVSSNHNSGLRSVNPKS